MSQKIVSGEQYEPAFEVHLSDIIAFFRKYILLIAIIAVASAILGYLSSYIQTEKYTAKTILLPEYSAAKSSFFALAVSGNNTDGPGNLTPDLYPNVLESSSFGEYLLNQPITTQSGQKYATLKSYLAKPSSPGLLARIRSFFSSNKSATLPHGPKLDLKGSGVLYYSKEETALISGAKSMVSASIEQKSNLISIESELPDPVLAALVVENAKNYLIDYVEDVRTAKLTQQLTFLTGRTEEAKKRLKSAEYALQSYRDQNRNAFLNVARIEEQRLQAEYTLAQSIYSDLVFKQEQMRIRVKEERPVFKVLETTKVPLTTSSPRRLIMAILFAGIGAFASLLYIAIIKEKFHQKLMKG